ncbi:MAG: hypothetical protein J5878_07320 [Oscillospiraceae bacterium]|nr:hypothetical protein [Oscillospiraceae bacterium]
MQYPKLKPIARRRVQVDAFRGYEHKPAVRAGAFYDMKNLSGERAPLLCVRRRRTQVEELDGCPTEEVLAVAGRGTPVILDIHGTLWAGGNSLARMLPGESSLIVRDTAGNPVPVLMREAILEALTRPGTYVFRFNANRNLWLHDGGPEQLPADSFDVFPRVSGQTLILMYDYSLRYEQKRKLVFLGGWVCVFPDGAYANTVKLRQGQEMIRNVDYGQIEQANVSAQGRAVFQICSADGTPLTVTWSESAPQSGCWVDTSEQDLQLRSWSESQGLWVEVKPFVKCSIPGIATGLLAGDGVELSCLLLPTLQGWQELARLWSGTHVLTAAYHDPGDANRPEGTEDYVILPGLLPRAYNLNVSSEGYSHFELCRALPKMDYVVEAANRRWGCRCGNGVNELYGSKLGDFRNWSVFEGLSTDSYRVGRGHDGPYTGAAVLGGCPLFFRSDCLEKIFPSSNGDHGVVTVSLSGIESGSSGSAVVIRDRLYYKSVDGICAYGGTLPTLVSGALGDQRYRNAVGAAVGSRYYVCMESERAESCLFVLDTDTGCWYREEDTDFVEAYSQDGYLYLLPRAGESLICVNEATDSREVSWYAETGNLAAQMGEQRFVTRLRITARLDQGSELRVYLSCDGGPWLRKGEIHGNELQTLTLPLSPRRCRRFRLRLEGIGGMELHQLAWQTEGSADL